MSYRHIPVSKEPSTRYIADGGVGLLLDVDRRAQRPVTIIHGAVDIRLS